MQEIPAGMASVNGKPAVPLKDAVDEVVRGLRSKLGHALASSEEEANSGVAADRLRSIVDRIERLEEEKKALSDDIKDIFSEAKGAGFDLKALRQIIRMRKWEPAELEQHETLVDLYRRALGM